MVTRRTVILIVFYAVHFSISNTATSSSLLSKRSLSIIALQPLSHYTACWQIACQTQRHHVGSWNLSISTMSPCQSREHGRRNRTWKYGGQSRARMSEVLAGILISRSYKHATGPGGVLTGFPETFLKFSLKWKTGVPKGVKKCVLLKISVYLTAKRRYYRATQLC